MLAHAKAAGFGASEIKLGLLLSLCTSRFLWANVLPHLRPVRADRSVWRRSLWNLQQQQHRHHHHHHSSPTVGCRRSQTLDDDPATATKWIKLRTVHQCKSLHCRWNLRSCTTGSSQIVGTLHSWPYFKWQKEKACRRFRHLPTIHTICVIALLCIDRSTLPHLKLRFIPWWSPIRGMPLDCGTSSHRKTFSVLVSHIIPHQRNHFHRLELFHHRSMQFISISLLPCTNGTQCFAHCRHVQ